MAATSNPNKNATPLANLTLQEAIDKAQRDMVLEVADHSLLTIASLVGKDSIDLSPQFQRRDRWTVKQQSTLIESFFLNLPVPPVYLSEEDDGIFSVIDGKQRISAIRDFFADALTLQGLERLPQAEGLRYSELDRSIQGKLDKRPIRAVTILGQSDATLKYEVFLRLNREGEVLNAQEIRNVAFSGPFNSAVYSLAENEFLRTRIKATTPKSGAYKNMLDAEYVLRFLMLSEGWHSFKGDFREALDSFAFEHRNADERTISRFESKFNRAIDACEGIFGSQAFRRPGGRDEAIAAMFDAEMVALSQLSNEQLRKLNANTSTVWESLTELAEDSEFEKSVRSGTNTPGRVKYRISNMISMFDEVLSRS